MKDLEIRAARITQLRPQEQARRVVQPELIAQPILVQGSDLQVRRGTTGDPVAALDDNIVVIGNVFETPREHASVCAAWRRTLEIQQRVARREQVGDLVARAQDLASGPVQMNDSFAFNPVDDHVHDTECGKFRRRSRARAKRPHLALPGSALLDQIDLRGVAGGVVAEDAVVIQGPKSAVHGLQPLCRRPALDTRLRLCIRGHRCRR